MKKGVFIETVLLRLTGGNLTDEASVKRVDIEAYLPSCINYAMDKAYNINIKTEGNRDYLTMFYGTFNDLVIDRTGKIPTIILPKGYAPLPRNQGIRFISDNCGHYFSPLGESERRQIKYYETKMQGSQFYFPIGNKIELFGINPLEKKINAVIIVNINDLTMEDELPLSGNVEMDAINICLQFMSGQRTEPIDVINNKVDLNTAK